MSGEAKLRGKGVNQSKGELSHIKSQGESNGVSQSKGELSPVKSQGESNGVGEQNGVNHPEPQVPNEINGDIMSKPLSVAGSGFCSKLIVFLLLGSFSLTLSIYLVAEYKDGPVSTLIDYTVPKEYGEILIGHINDDLAPFVDQIMGQVKERIRRVSKGISIGNEKILESVVQVYKYTNQLYKLETVKSEEGKENRHPKNGDQNMQAEEEGKKKSEDIIKEEEADNLGDQTRNAELEATRNEERMREAEEAKMKEIKMRAAEEEVKTRIAELKLRKVKKEKIKSVKMREAEEELNKEVVQEKEAEQWRDTEQEAADDEAKKEVQKRLASKVEAAQEAEAFKKAKDQMKEALKESEKWSERERGRVSKK